MSAFHAGFLILGFLCQRAVCLTGSPSISNPSRWNAEDWDKIPVCFCDTIGPEESTAIEINCIYGSVPDDLKNAAKIVEAAQKNVRGVFLSLMDFGEGLTANFFEGFQFLRNITIFECLRQETLYIDNDAFNGLEGSLEELRIYQCALETVPAVVRNLTTLKTLFLKEVDIHELFADDFIGLTGLQNLDLSNNRITHMNPLCFQPLVNLQTLVLGPRNRLNESSFEAINQLSSLEMLDVQGSWIDFLPPGAFNGLRNLEYLHLQSNNLASLTSGVFDGLSSLKHLDLRVNLVENIDGGTFSELKELKTLLLAGNYISQIDAHTFKGLGKLEKLDIGWNEFKSLGPNIFANLANLTILDIRHTKRLSKIDLHAFSGLEKLERLNLSDTKIGSLNGQIDPLGSLKYLDLSNITLQLLNNYSFVSVPKLKELYLKNNNITSLSPTVFDSVPLLEVLDISGNPWNCNQSLWGLVEFLHYKYMYNDSTLYVKNSLDMLCDKLKRLKGTMLMSLNERILQSLEVTTTISSHTDAAADDDIVNAKLKQLHEELGNFIEAGNPVCKSEAIQYVEPLLNFLNQTYGLDPDSLLC